MKRKKLNSAEAKIMAGLEDAIAFAKGDMSRGIVHYPKADVRLAVTLDNIRAQGEDEPAMSAAEFRAAMRKEKLF